MSNYVHNNFFLYRQALSFCLLFCFAVSYSPAATSNTRTITEADTGYSALAMFLENQEQLKTLRSVRSFLTRQRISTESAKLIDEISDYSSQALIELKQQTAKEPTILLVEFSDDTISIETFDSLRMSTAKELMFDSKNFEKNLLLSQTQVLRVISHLAEQLRKKEHNRKRKVWLHDLSKRYEDYYNRVFQRIALN